MWRGTNRKVHIVRHPPTLCSERSVTLEFCIAAIECDSSLSTEVVIPASATCFNASTMLVSNPFARDRTSSAQASRDRTVVVVSARSCRCAVHGSWTEPLPSCTISDAICAEVRPCCMSTCSAFCGAAAGASVRAVRERVVFMGRKEKRKIKKRLPAGKALGDNFDLSVTQ